jgi:hypothetical protein
MAAVTLSISGTSATTETGHPLWPDAAPNGPAKMYQHNNMSTQQLCQQPMNNPWLKRGNLQNRSAMATGTNVLRNDARSVVCSAVPYIDDAFRDVP